MLIALAIFGGLTLWYGAGLLGSVIGLFAANSNNWTFGIIMAIGGPLNLIAATLFAIMNLRRN